MVLKMVFLQVLETNRSCKEPVYYSAIKGKIQPVLKKLRCIPFIPFFIFPSRELAAFSV